MTPLFHVQYIQELYEKYEYEEVGSPNIYNFKLWETSGHAEHYKDNMFVFQVEKQEFGLKPMNCPGVLVHLPSIHATFYMPHGMSLRVRCPIVR